MIVQKTEEAVNDKLEGIGNGCSEDIGYNMSKCMSSKSVLWMKKK